MNLKKLKWENAFALGLICEKYLWKAEQVRLKRTIKTWCLLDQFTHTWLRCWDLFQNPSCKWGSCSLLAVIPPSAWPWLPKPHHGQCRAPSKELLLHPRGLVLSTPGSAASRALASQGQHSLATLQTQGWNLLQSKQFSLWNFDIPRPVLHYPVTFQISLKFSQLRWTHAFPSICCQSLLCLKCSFSSLSFSHSSLPPCSVKFLITT